MQRIVKIAACQVPYLTGDADKAISIIKTFSEKADSEGVRLLCFPECFLHGYIVEEKFARLHAQDLSSSNLKSILERLPKRGPMLVIGLIEAEEGKLFNSAVVIKNGEIAGCYRKTHLLKGESIFEAGTSYPVFEIDGLRFGINICYDTNFPETALAIAKQNAELIVCPSNNMMRREKSEAMKHVHNEVRGERCRETGLWLISSDVTGENDNKISYGPTAVINPEGNVVSQVPLLEVGMVTAEIPVKAI